MWGAPLPLMASPGGPPQLYEPICDDLVSNAADHDVVWAGDYRAVLFSVDHLVPASNNVFIRIRTSSDGGATFDSGATDYRHEVSTTAGVTRFNQSTGGPQMQIVHGSSGLSNNADFGYSGDFVLAQPFDGKPTVLHGQAAYWPNEGIVTTVAFYGQRSAAARVDALRFFIVDGVGTPVNISTARVRARGILPYGEGA